MMSMKMERYLALTLTCTCCLALHAAEQVWQAEPADAHWNETSPNWDDGTTWTSNNVAIFGASTVTNVLVEGLLFTGGITFNADGYVIGGDGTLVVPNAVTSSFTVPENATATLRVAVTNLIDSMFTKKGAGTLTLMNAQRTLRTRVQQGTLALISNELATAKLNGMPGSDTTLYCDAATIFGLTSNNGIMLGDTGEGGGYGAFTRALIGPNGLTFKNNGDIIVKQAFATAPGVEHDGGIALRGSGVISLVNVVNTFNGGIDVYNNQLRFNTNTVFGSGTLRLHQGGNAVLEGGGEVHVTNKVVFDNAAYMATTGSDADCVVLHNVAFPADGGNEWKNLHVGRVGQGFSRAKITLDGPDNEPIGNFYLRGALDLTIDGGLIRSTPNCATPFFNSTQLASNSLPIATVGPKGFHFDTNGSTTDLGLTLVTVGGLETNYLGCASGFANPSFESNQTGWTLKETSPYTGSGRKTDGSAFTSDDPTYETPDGSAFMIVRQLGELSTSFTVPEDGDWRVVFDVGCRPKYSSHKLSVTVTVDGETVLVVPPRDIHRFTRYETEVKNLAAGDHALKLVVGDEVGKDGQYESVYFDAFALERRELVTYPGPPVVKYGEGSLSITNLVTDGMVAVSNGTLAVSDFMFDGATLDVAAGGTLAACDGLLANASVRVAAGGTFSFRNGRNVIPYGDFESLDAGTGGFFVYTKFACWTMTTLGAQTATSGIQRNGGTVSENWYATPCGQQTAYVRSSSKMTGVFDVDRAGAYHLSFLHCARNYSNSYNLPLYVMVDGVTNLVVAPRTAFYDYRREEADLQLGVGAHEIVFEVGGGTQSGAMLFLDDIRIESSDPLDHIVSETRFDFASGSTLDLQNSFKLELVEGIYRSGGVYVDGVRVQGGRAAFERLGVTVTGSGDIQVGPPVGTVYLLR